MPVSFIIGAAGGLASAALFYSAARGSPLLSTFLLLLTPLPTLLAGLGWGWMPAVAGALAGAIAMAIAVSGTFAVGYFLALGAPAALIAYLAYLNRTDPDDPGLVEWYPAGRLMAAMAIYAGVLPLLFLPLIGGSYEVLRAPLMGVFQRLSSGTAPGLGMPSLTPEQIENLATLFVAALPGAIAAYWLGIFTINTYLAGRIARASGRLGRDWPDLAAMTYPPGFPLLLAAAATASFAPGLIGTAGTSFSGGFLFAYFVLGLALVHFVARGRAPWILWFVYAGLIVSPYAAVALVLGGLLEPILKLRQRFGTTPPAPPPSTPT